MKCLFCDNDMVFDSAGCCGTVKIEKYFNCTNCQIRTICKYCREEVVVNPHIIEHNVRTKIDACNNINYVSLKVVLEAVEPLTIVDSFIIELKNRGLIP